MKRIYMKPVTKMVTIRVQQNMLAGSYIVSNTTATGDALGRQDNSWDIWGSDDDIDD